jgi:hypothetical protein
MEEVEVMKENNEDNSKPHFHTSGQDDDFDQELMGIKIWQMRTSNIISVIG